MKIGHIVSLSSVIENRESRIGSHLTSTATSLGVAHSIDPSRSIVGSKITVQYGVGVDLLMVWMEACLIRRAKALVGLLSSYRV